jgi:hypothetical protein
MCVLVVRYNLVAQSSLPYVYRHVVMMRVIQLDCAAGLAVCDRLVVCVQT